MNRRKSGRAADPLWADLTVVPATSHATPQVKQDATIAHAAGGGPLPLNSCSSTRSVGSRMKTSHMMSGSCWLPLMKPITRRPVTSSITATKRAHQLLELHPLLDHRAAAPALKECLLDA